MKWGLSIFSLKKGSWLRRVFSKISISKSTSNPEHMLCTVEDFLWVCHENLWTVLMAMFRGSWRQSLTSPSRSYNKQCESTIIKNNFKIIVIKKYIYVSIRTYLTMKQIYSNQMRKSVKEVLIAAVKWLRKSSQVFFFKCWLQLLVYKQSCSLKIYESALGWWTAWKISNSS